MSTFFLKAYSPPPPPQSYRCRTFSTVFLVKLFVFGGWFDGVKPVKDASTSWQHMLKFKYPIRRFASMSYADVSFLQSLAYLMLSLWARTRKKLFFETSPTVKSIVIYRHIDIFQNSKLHFFPVSLVWKLNTRSTIRAEDRETVEKVKTSLFVWLVDISNEIDNLSRRLRSRWNKSKCHSTRWHLNSQSILWAEDREYEQRIEKPQKYWKLHFSFNSLKIQTRSISWAEDWEPVETNRDRFRH